MMTAREIHVVNVIVYDALRLYNQWDPTVSSGKPIVEIRPHHPDVTGKVIGAVTAQLVENGFDVRWRGT